MPLNKNLYPLSGTCHYCDQPADFQEMTQQATSAHTFNNDNLCTGSHSGPQVND